MELAGDVLLDPQIVRSPSYSARKQGTVLVSRTIGQATKFSLLAQRGDGSQNKEAEARTMPAH